jgi:hypothetical protein
MFTTSTAMLLPHACDSSVSELITALVMLEMNDYTQYNNRNLSALPSTILAIRKDDRESIIKQLPYNTFLFTTLNTENLTKSFEHGTVIVLFSCSRNHCIRMLRDIRYSFFISKYINFASRISMFYNNKKQTY